MNTKIKQLQGKLLEMLLKLDAFCSENNIDYYLIGGSALGAVRHGGFIPWDDDIDVAMMREDFERFEKIAEGKKIADLLYEPIEKHSFPEAPIGFLYDVSNPDIPLEDAPCIDVFPLDGIPESSFSIKKLKYSALLYHISVYRQPAQNRGKLNALLTRVFIALTPNRLFDFYMAKMKKAITKYLVSDSKHIANIYGMRGFNNEIMPKEYMGTPTKLSFEGHMLPVPEQYDKYLTHLFGDYMTLPPVEERQPHHTELKWEE